MIKYLPFKYQKRPFLFIKSFQLYPEINKQISMYSNYLIDVGKLVFVVGDTQNTMQFKNLFQSSGNLKQNIFYKCVQQLPADTFKKAKFPEEKKGIIRKDWISKILNKNPEMIVMVFNCTSELEENQVWEDRLRIIIKKINKVYDVMKSNDKEDVRLKIIVLISKHTFGGVNLHQKITNFLKNYQKQLFVIQIEYYAKEITKVRSQWVYALQKNYDTKYRKLQKRYEESFLQRKLGCMVKMAILSEMLSKKDEKQKYIETYKALRYRFSDVIKSVTILNHNQIRELRGVADVIFLRYLKSLVLVNSSAQVLFKLTIDHMNFYKLKNLGLNQTHKYYYYEQLLWRCTFIENFFEILYKNDLMESVSPLSLCQLLNELVAYLHALSIVHPQVLKQQRNLGAELLQQREELYIGLSCYNTDELLQTDVIFSFMNGIILHKKDYLTKGIQLITRYKTMNIFKKNQLLFLNVYLLRFFYQDNKFQSFLTTYDEIMRQQISRSNFFLLNQIFNQIQDEFKSINQAQKVMFYGVSSLICDYFQNYASLQNHLDHLLVSLKTQKQQNSKLENVKIVEKERQNDYLSGAQNNVISEQKPRQQGQNSTQLNQAYKFSLKKNSSIASVGCFIKNEFVYIEEQIRLKLQIQVNPVISTSGYKITFMFNHKSVNKEINIPAGSANCFEKVFSIQPLEYFTKDESLRIDCVRIEVASVQKMTFVIPNNHITFIKHKQNKIYTKIKCPEIQINNPYSIYYINEVAKFQINIEKLQGFITEAKCSIKEDDAYGKTQVFIDFDERINLTNSNYYQELVTQNKIINQFWLKCNKIGQKSLKFTFHFTIQKIIQKVSSDLLQQRNDSQEQRHVLKQHFNITKQMKFTIKQLFNIKKTYYEFSNDDNRILESKNIPVDKKVLAVLEISSNEDVQIIQIGQHKNPKKVQYLKQISKRDFLLRKDCKMKLNMIFKVGLECKDEIQLFLMSNYIKWSRTQAKIFSSPYQNLFLDHETKISCFLNPLSIFLKTSDNYLVKKNEPNKLVLTVKNHSTIKNHVFVQVEGNQSILRIGQKGKEMYVQPFSQKFLDFDILPTMSGFLQIPTIKVFVDGIQRSINVTMSQFIKCL